MGRSYAARVLSIIKRFTMPILILGVLVAALVASNKYGYDDIETLPKSSQINAELETQVFSIRRAPELLTSPLELEKLSTNFHLKNDFLVNLALSKARGIFCFFISKIIFGQISD